MPPRPVPPWRLLLAWLALAGGIAAFWSAGPYLNTVGGLYAFVAAWFLTSKTASLLCLRSDEFRRLSWGRLIAYFIFPGTQPRHFLPERKPSPQDVRPTLLGVLLNFTAGALFLWGVPWLLPEQTPWLARAWVGLIGLSFLVLFVRFDVAVLIFRLLGFGVEKCWHCPVAATSLADFWGSAGTASCRACCATCCSCRWPAASAARSRCSPSSSTAACCTRRPASP